MAGELVLVVGRRPQFLTVWTSPRAACVFSGHGAGFPQKQHFYDLGLEVTEHHSPHSLIIRSVT